MVFGSDWLSTLAMYYLLLCVIRFTPLRANRKVTALTDQAARMRKEWKACRVCGEVFMGMTVILMGDSGADYSRRIHFLHMMGC